jgi:hypothetical protein
MRIIKKGYDKIDTYQLIYFLHRADILDLFHIKMDKQLSYFMMHAQSLLKAIKML